MSYALATSPTEPVRRFECASDLVRAILGRPGPQASHTIVRGACWPDGESHAALAVYGHDRGSAFLGYVIGFGHDHQTLRLILDSARRERSTIRHGQGGGGAKNVPAEAALADRLVDGRP